MRSFVGVCSIILLGSSILLGLLVFKYAGDNKKLYSFVDSMVLIGFVLLGIFYLFAECINFLEGNYNLVQCYSYLFLMVLLGIFVIKVILYFLPKKEDRASDFIYSYVILSLIGALIIFIEGVIVYNTKGNYLNLFLLFVKFFLYNFVLGSVLSTNFKKHHFGLIKSFKYLLGVSIFGIFGYLISFNENFLYKNSLFMGSILGVLIGILFYVIIVIYVDYFKENKNSTAKTLGLVVGGIILLLSNLL